ncbi:exosporium protein C [Paenibacillus sp. 481]|uniref:exosporium protein C n=1 Tax=Paenibacillus sp. 481 TaxID=2835869 RepID=UPI001E616D8E|nr:exosporium protein C [Paenibacillus sp. 481]UHA75630.1 exosporium protein C [Paenibacillus sp. 481]
MSRVLDYRAVQPLSRFSLSNSVIIAQSPRRTRFAIFSLNIPQSANLNNRVELIASVGVRGVTGIAQVVFRIFRDGNEIFRTQQGVESAASEQNYIFSFQGIDANLRSGSHTYFVTAENLTTGTRADIVGPTSFSGLAIQR